MARRSKAGTTPPARRRRQSRSGPRARSIARQRKTAVNSGSRFTQFSTARSTCPPNTTRHAARSSETPRPPPGPWRADSAEKGPAARKPVSGLKALDQALDHARCGPHGNQAGDDQQQQRPRPRDAKLLHDELFGTRGHNFGERILNGVRDKLRARLHQDGGRGRKHREKRKQRGVGGALGDAETTIVERRLERAPEQPPKVRGFRCATGPV